MSSNSDPLYDEKKAHFEAKKEGKLAAFSALAVKKAKESAAAFKREHDILDMIPMGQPILVGHHSEKRHRSDLNKAENLFRKGIELKETSEYYAHKVDLIENSSVISSDDPDAIAKLEKKLAGIEAEIERVKAHNKNCKVIHLALYSFANGTHVSNDNGSYQTYAVVKDGVIDWKVKRVPKEIKPIIEDYAKTGKLVQPPLKEENKKIEGWVLQNLNGNKKRVKDRIESLKNLIKVPDLNKSINGVDLIVDKVENRVRLVFPGKPAPEIIQKLKSNGFHWSPYNKDWRRQISDRALYLAEEILKEVKA